MYRLHSGKNKTGCEISRGAIVVKKYNKALEYFKKISHQTKKDEHTYIYAYFSCLVAKYVRKRELKLQTAAQPLLESYKKIILLREKGDCNIIVNDIVCQIGLLYGILKCPGDIKTLQHVGIILAGQIQYNEQNPITASTAPDFDFSGLPDEYEKIFFELRDIVFSDTTSTSTTRFFDMKKMLCKDRVVHDHTEMVELCVDINTIELKKKINFAKRTQAFLHVCTMQIYTVIFHKKNITVNQKQILDTALTHCNSALKLLPLCVQTGHVKSRINYLQTQRISLLFHIVNNESENYKNTKKTNRLCVELLTKEIIEQINALIKNMLESKENDIELSCKIESLLMLYIDAYMNESKKFPINIVKITKSYITCVKLAINHNGDFKYSEMIIWFLYRILKKLFNEKENAKVFKLSKIIFELLGNVDNNNMHIIKIMAIINLHLLWEVPLSNLSADILALRLAGNGKKGFGCLKVLIITTGNETKFNAKHKKTGQTVLMLLLNSVKISELDKSEVCPIIKTLVARGAKTNEIDNDKKSVAEYAKEAGITLSNYINPDSVAVTNNLQ